MKKPFVVSIIAILSLWATPAFAVGTGSLHAGTYDAGDATHVTHSQLPADVVTTDLGPCKGGRLIETNHLGHSQLAGVVRCVLPVHPSTAGVSVTPPAPGVSCDYQRQLLVNTPVTCQVAVAGISHDTTTPDGLAVAITAVPADVTWDFGDGSTTSGPVASHVWRKSGPTHITATVTWHASAAFTDGVVPLPDTTTATTINRVALQVWAVPYV